MNKLGRIVSNILFWPLFVVVISVLAAAPSFIMFSWNNHQRDQVVRAQIYDEAQANHQLIREMASLPPDAPFDQDLFSSTIIHQYQTIERLRRIHGWRYDEPTAGYLISEYYAKLMIDLKDDTVRSEDPYIRVVRTKGTLIFFDEPFEWLMAQ